MRYRSWLAAAGVAVVVLAVIVGISMTSGETGGDSAGGSSAEAPGQGSGSGGGASGDPSTAQPLPQPQPSPSGPRSDRPMPLPQPVAPRDQPERPGLRLGASIQSYELLASDRLQLRYTTGVPECYGRVHRTVVDETDRRVTVTLLLRPPAGAGQRACPEMAVVDDTVVRLAEPLGDRVVVDGGTQRAVRRGHEPM
jgi:hypothetical protein